MEVIATDGRGVSSGTGPGEMRPVDLPPSACEHADVAARLRAAGCVFAEEEAAIALAEHTTARELEAMVAARSTGVPLEQVVGWAQFCGLRIAVRPGRGCSSRAAAPSTWYARRPP